MLGYLRVLKGVFLAESGRLGVPTSGNSNVVWEAQKVSESGVLHYLSRMFRMCRTLGLYPGYSTLFSPF